VNFGRILLVLVGTPGLQVVLKLLGLLKLQPLAHWGHKDTFELLTYVAAVVAAIITSFGKRNTNLKEGLVIGGATVCLITSCIIYFSIYSSAPRSDLLQLIDVAAYASFFLAYIAYGVVVARIVAFVALRTPDRTDQGSK
jgi:CHASE2 domain-containing sensor protein